MREPARGSEGIEFQDLVERSAPRFCGRCDVDVPAGEWACPTCGEAPADQGYCPVCECFWRREPGSECPKHDLPLEDRVAAPGSAGPPVAAPRWVTVATFGETNEAAPSRLRLEAEGVPTFLDGEFLGQNVGFQLATGGVKLQVPEPLAAEARILLAQRWTSERAADDLDDAWDGLSPEPWAGRHTILKVAILGGILVWFVAVVFEVLRWALAR